MHPVTPAGVLAGRDDELALLDGLLRDLAQGSGNAVLIEGEPGIGKTALVRAALSAAADGFQPPTGAQSRARRAAARSSGAPGTSSARNSRSFRSSTRSRCERRRRTPGGPRSPGCSAARSPPTAAPTCLRCWPSSSSRSPSTRPAPRPVVLVIDDLHWADPASVKLWGRLARTAHQVPLLLIGITRPVPQREDLLALRRAVRGRASRPARLAPSAGRGRARRDAGRRQAGLGLLALAAGAAGNPLYLTEMLAALARSGGISVTHAGTAQLAAGTVPDSLPGRDRGPARVRLRAHQGGASRGGAARGGVRDHRPDGGARQNRRRPGSRA